MLAIRRYVALVSFVGSCGPTIVSLSPLAIGSCVATRLPIVGSCVSARG
jgi:hypothetical protein